MKKKLEAIETAGPYQFDISDDGKTIVLHFDAGGTTLPLAVPADRVFDIIGMMIAINAAINPRGKMVAGQRTAFLTDWWEMHPASDGSFVLGLRIPSRGFLDFRLDPGMVRQLREYLLTLQGENSEPHGTLSS